MRYSYQAAAFDLGQITAEVQALALPGFAGCGGEDGTFWADFDPPLSGAGLARLDAAVQAHAPDPQRPLRLAREAAVALVDSAEAGDLRHRAAWRLLVGWCQAMSQWAAAASAQVRALGGTLPDPPGAHDYPTLEQAVRSSLPSGAGDPDP